MARQYTDEKEDRFYTSRGAKPPERNAHMTEEELEKALIDHLQGHVCDWEQAGSEIFCDIADFRHGKRIGTSVRLAGTDPNGKPVLVPVGPIMRDSLH